MTPEEILAAIEAFQLLEPEVQRGIVGLVHLIHKTPAPLSPQDFIDKAQAILHPST